MSNFLAPFTQTQSREKKEGPLRNLLKVKVLLLLVFEHSIYIRIDINKKNLLKISNDYSIPSYDILIRINKHEINIY